MTANCAKPAVYSVVGARRIRAIAGYRKERLLLAIIGKFRYSDCCLARRRRRPLAAVA